MHFPCDYLVHTSLLPRMYIMPLITDVPPITLPRGQKHRCSGDARHAFRSGSVLYFQSISLPMKFKNIDGIWDPDGSSPPVSKTERKTIKT